MTSLLRRLRGQGESRFSIDDLAAAYSFNGNAYHWYQLRETSPGVPAESVPHSFPAYANSLYASNGIVFACMAVRQLLFSEARLRFRRLVSGRPGDLFGTSELAKIETPWPGGTTGDLLSTMIVDADLAGNAYMAWMDGEFVRLRPDWTDIKLVPRMRGDGQVGFAKAGYLYREGGDAGQSPVVHFGPNEVAHFAPIRDPLATYRGMSWLTPVIREIVADGQFTQHKSNTIANGATPNMVVKGLRAASQSEFDELIKRLNLKTAGVDNAGKTLYLAEGMDATVVGSNLQQLDFKQVQGAGETRIAAAARIPAVVLGISEGLAGSSLNAGNYRQAARQLSDGLLSPLLRNVCGSLAPLVKVPVGAELWFDIRDVPFLRDDRIDEANILAAQAAALRSLVDSGFSPESAIAAVSTNDITRLEHSGLLSVQLLPPGESGSSVPAA